MKAQLRAQILTKLDKEKRQNIMGGGRSMEHPVTKRLCQTDAGLLCLELIREFMKFFQMDYSLQVFTPEASIGNLPMARWEMERDLKIAKCGDNTKPMLLKLIEQVRGEEFDMETVKRISKDSQEQKAGNPSQFDSNSSS
jgi:hypothetical protein